MMYLLAEGGAYGHLAHLYDNRDLTFAELKEVVVAASRGKLEKVTEKTDGMNLVFSWSIKDDGLKVARSAGDIKGGGMDAAKLAARFQDRGNITDAFNSAFEVLSRALKVLSNNVKKVIFGSDADNWYSIEVIYSKNPNVINYDNNYLVFHAHGSFRLVDGKVVQDSDAPGIDLLATHIENMQKATTDSSWKLAAPQLAALKSLSDKSVARRALDAISAVQSKAGLDDSSTIGDYVHTMFFRSAKSLGFDEKTTHAIASRCAGEPGSPNLNDIKKMVGKDGFQRTSEFVKDAQKSLTSFIEPLEMAIHELSIEVLKGLESVMISNHEGEVNRLRDEVSTAIKAIEASGNAAAIEVLNRQLKKLGSIDRITSSAEGVVFRYHDNVYKFTGSFAPINQILGLFKYGRKGTVIKQTTTENLRALINLMVEASPLKKGQEMDQGEIDAKKRLDVAKAELDAWDKNEKVKSDLFAKAKQLGITPATARKRLKNDPAYQYDPKISQKQRKTLELSLQKAEDEYAEYDPAFRGFVASRRPPTAKGTANKELPPNDKKQLMSIDSIKPLVWYKWPQGIAKSGKSFGSSKLKSGNEDAGVGPGEEWIAYTFGGQVQGGSVSFDIVTKDGRSWEVKALDGASDLIRPGTEGLKAFEQPRRRLNNIMTQMKNFVNTAKKPGFIGPNDLTPEQKRVIDYVTVFVQDNFEMIVGKSEISKSKFINLRGVLKAINHFKTLTAQETGASGPPADTRVGLNDKQVKVDKKTFIDVAKKVEKATGDKNVLADIQKNDVLMSTLVDSAFNDSTTFFDDWFDSVDINKVFEQVDGLFIVNPRGFVMIPASMFKRALGFEKVSQGLPKFGFRMPWGP